MISILSLVTSVKDYVEIIHKLIETDSNFKISNYSDLGPVITYILITLKQFFIDVLSLNWLKTIWDLPIIIPDISSAMISEISVLDGYFHNAFNFLDKPISYGETNLAIYSLEKFLIARRLMYWQVYLHKTVLAAENMLIKIIERARILHKRKLLQYIPSSLKYFMDNDITEEHLSENALFLLAKFASLDDIDIFSAIKEWQNEEDHLLSFICKSLLNRELFKLKFSDNNFCSSVSKNSILDSSNNLNFTASS